MHYEYFKIIDILIRLHSTLLRCLSYKTYIITDDKSNGLSSKSDRYTESKETKYFMTLDF